MKNTILKIMRSIFKNGFSHGLVFNTIFVLSFFLCTFQVSAADSYISTKGGQNLFPLVADGQSAPLCVSSQDYSGVLKVAGHLQTDIKHVTGIEPKIITDKAIGNTIVIIGTIGKNPVIDKLIEEKKIPGSCPRHIQIGDSTCFRKPFL